MPRDLIESNKDTITVISDEKVLPRLSSEELLERDWNVVSPIHHRLKKTMQQAAAYQFAQDMVVRLLRATSDSSAKVIRIGKLQFQWTTADFLHWSLWILSWFAASFMISRAIKVSLAGVPWKDLIALVISTLSTVFIDWAIADVVTDLLCRHDAKLVQAEVNLRKQEAENLKPNCLPLKRAETQQGVLNEVQAADLHDQHWSKRGPLLIAITLMVVEYLATLFYVQKTGNELDLLTFAVSLVGILFTVLMGWFKGQEIDYPEKKSAIAREYAQLWMGVNLEPLKRQTNLLNDLTDFLLRHPDASVEELEQQENYLFCRYLFTDLNTIETYHLDEIEKFEKEAKERVRHLEDRHNVTMDDDDISKLLAQIDEERLRLHQRHRLEVAPLEREMKERQCSRCDRE